MSKKLDRAVRAKIIAGSSVLASIVGVAAILNVSAVSNNNSEAINVVALNDDTTVADTSEKQLVEETIYVFTKTDGSVRKVISSDWTKNLGIDEFTKTEKSDKSTPIDMKISYKLDGEPIEAKKLAGKSGRVTIRFDYTNKHRISGYYMPYVVMTGTVLDNNTFKNIEVKNGKSFNDGSRTIVAGFAFPGMQENLGLSTSAYEIPDYIEVSADATDFKLGMTMSLATSEVFANIDTTNLDSASALSSELTKLTDAMDKLVGGSSDLYNGIDKLYAETAKLPEGVATLKAGSAKLSAGAKQLDNGVNKLYNAINENFVSQNATLQQGATEITQSVLNSARLQITNSLSQQLNPIFAAGDHEPAEVQAILAELVPNFTIAGYSSEIDSIMPRVANLINGLNISDAEKAAYLNSLSGSATELANVKTSLAKVIAFYNGVYAYTNGLAYLNETEIKGSANDDKTSLKEATSALATGAGQLDEGLGTLNDATPKIVDGVGQLRDGSAKLRDGIKQFNNEGISKLVNAYANIDELLTRVKNIAAIARDNQKPVKYIYRTDEIK